MTDPVRTLVLSYAARVTAVALLVLLSERRLDDAPASEPPPFDLEGRTDEALPDCAAHTLAVEAARRGGRLPGLSLELLEANRKTPGDPRLLFGLAASLAELGDEDGALNLFASAVSRGSPCAASYRAFLHLSSKRGRLPEAAAVLEAVVRETPAHPHALVALGLAQEALGEGGLAMRSYERALLESPPTPSAHVQLASLLARVGRFEASLRVSELGLALFPRAVDPASSIRLMRLESRALLMLGRSEESDERFERALRAAEASERKLWLGETLIDGADLAGAAGDGKRALALLERAVEVEDEGFSTRERASFHLLLGNAFLGAGNRRRAEAHLKRGMDYAVRASEPHISTDARLALVYVWTTAGETTRALEEGARVLSEAIRLHDGGRQARAFAAMGAVYDRLGRYRDALESYRQALRFEERTLDRHRQALALGNLSLVYLRMGLPGPAVVQAHQALSLARVIPDVRLQASLKQAHAAALAGAGDFRQAERIYAEALSLVSRLSSPELLGLVLAGRGRVLLALGRLDEAERAIRDALDLAVRNGDSLLHLQAKSGLALVDWQRGDLRAAVEHLEESRRLVESSRGVLANEGDRMSYGETISQIYSNLSAILREVDRKEPDRAVRNRAFLAVEQSRARTLLDLLGNGAKRSPIAPSSDPVEPRASALKLGPQELLLSFELGERRSALWILSSRGLEWRELPSRSAIEREVEAFLDTIRLPPRSPENPFERHRERSRELYRLLLGPADSELSGATRLILSPDSMLYRLPFEALLAPSSGGSERYLVETHAVSYAPSAAVLANLRRRRRAPMPSGRSFLGIGQPATPSAPGQQSAIPYAAEEVESVGALFPPEKRRLLVGAAADEGSVKAAPLSEFRMLHIAAHGSADERYPLRSALFVGADEATGEDGILRMAEVLELELASDLVVLSGCETGRGRLLRSEGALGFSWAFLSAGASTVAVSLWNVNDRATSELMVAFYEGIVGERKEGATLAEAMARAKRKMLGSERRAYRHPYYWAPFVLIGSADGVGR